MTWMLVIGSFAVGIALAVAKGILGREIQGRIERRIRRHVDATIASLSPSLQDEYADEWQAELAVILSMPLTAAAFAGGLRRSAAQLAGEAGPAPSHALDRTLASGRRWSSGSSHRIRWRLMLREGMALFFATVLVLFVSAVVLLLLGLEGTVGDIVGVTGVIAVYVRWWRRTVSIVGKDPHQDACA